jgi:uncharacterized metal-binding protein
MSIVAKIKIIPCSGIGKVMGLLSRETALEVTEHLCPQLAETVCLGHLVTGEADARAKVAGLNCIPIDGCTQLCAAKSIKAAGGVIAAQYNTVDALRDHKNKKPGDGSALTEEGWAMVDDFAAKIADKVRELSTGTGCCCKSGCC